MQVRGHEIFQKWLSPHFYYMSLKFTETTWNGDQNINQTFLGCFDWKKNWGKFSNFLNYFAGPGSWNISKMTKSSFSWYEPKIHRNYLKFWSQRKVRLSWLISEKSSFENIHNFFRFSEAVASSVLCILFLTFFQISFGGSTKCH